jgi:hypothetical protein
MCAGADEVLVVCLHIANLYNRHSLIMCASVTVGVQ